MDAATFRADLPEFASAAVYPDAQVNLWVSVAALRLREAAWGDLLGHGTELFVAHNLTLARRNQAAATSGGVPGQNSGPIASKAVDKVSVSYDTGAASLTDAGHWNLTTYGTQFYQLARIIGMGGLQL